jgi:flagellar biosynthesis/type III secretory pathway protein FliH
MGIEELIKERMLLDAEEKGIAKGIEKGIKQGIAKGIEQGIAKGIEQGIEKNTIQVIELMLQKGFEPAAIVEILEVDPALVRKVIGSLNKKSDN